MKVRSHVWMAVLFAAILFTSCKNQPEGDEASIGEEQQVAATEGATYSVNTADSWIRFVGYGVGKNHPGKFKLSGTASVAGSQVSGGAFTIDIKSMELEEKGKIFDEKLRPHLMSGDFFDADKFGNAKFEITEVKPYEKNDKDSSVVEGANFSVSGNLTLKNVTKNVTFPAKIDLDGATLKSKAEFVIDRTQWQMNYGNDKTLKDKFISEDVTIELDITATKQ